MYSEDVHVHHMKPRREFPDEKLAHWPQNLVVLCPSCHPKIENISQTMYPLETSQQTKTAMISYLLRNRIVGCNSVSITNVVEIASQITDQLRGRQLIEEMISDADAPIESYGGGHRENVRLTGVDAAVDYLKDNGGNVPFNFDS